MADDITLTQPDLINRLLDNLPTGYTQAQVNTPNAKSWTTPKNKKFLRITVVPFDSTSEAATGEYIMTNGLCAVDIYYPKNSGDIEQLEDAKAIKQIYQNQTFGNTQCQTVSIKPLGEQESWYVVQAQIEFYMAGFSY